MMKHFLTTLLIGGFLLITTHRSPAPVTEIPETTPTATAAPKPTQAPPAEEKSKEKKVKAKQAENEATPKRGAAETTKLPVAGTWRGHWDNSRGEQGTAMMVFNEGPNGVITGETDALPLSGRPSLQNGHRSGNTIAFSFHRANRDYQVTMTVSPDGTTLSGQYKVVQDQKVVYTGKYSDFKRK